MATWRMACRDGNQGHELWPDCYERGVAAITYWAAAEKDLCGRASAELAELCEGLTSTQKASLRRVVLEMQKGDVIYVKQGPWIVGRGKVTGPYQFDGPDNPERFIDSDGHPWSHQVPVKWENNFQPVRILLGGEQVTVLKLTEERLQELRAAVATTRRAVKKRETFEGEVYRREATFRRRNPSLIEAKKTSSDGYCEACNFSFKRGYGLAERDCLVAHHVEPIGNRRGASPTTLDDIALLCPNCHAVVHTQDPPMSVAELRRRVR